MKEIQKRLNRSLEHYRGLQKEQIQAFETCLAPDIETHNFKRTQVFAQLKNDLDDLMNLVHDNKDIEILAFYRTRIDEILAEDDLLREKLIRYRNELAAHMGQANKSKVAFDGYYKSAGSIRKNHYM